MTPPTPDLARRAIACKGWRWMPRMAVRPVLSNGTVESAVGTIIGFVRSMPVVWWPDLADPRSHDPKGHLLPDLSDPATLGCMLALVREAWGDPHAYLAPGDGWCVGRGARDGIYGDGATEAEALVAALEAAPVAGCAR